MEQDVKKKHGRERNKKEGLMVEILYWKKNLLTTEIVKTLCFFIR